MSLVLVAAAAAAAAALPLLVTRGMQRIAVVQLHQFSYLASLQALLVVLALMLLQ
jgi:hypothetical protein